MSNKETQKRKTEYDVNNDLQSYTKWPSCRPHY